MAERVRVIATRGLNVRTGAGTQYARVGALPYGAVATVVSRSGVWGEISAPLEGWIHLGYTEPVGAPPPDEEGEAYIETPAVDLSLWNRVDSLFWATARPWVTILKATQGVSILDPHFGERWVRARFLDWPRWSYHFYDPAVPGEDQAEVFLRVSGIQQGERAVLDLEWIAPYDELTWAADGVDAWLSLVEQATGTPPVVYTRRDVWMAYFGDASHPWAEERGWPLWIADYRGTEEPLMVPGWTRWALWQYTSTGRWPGVAGNVDLSRVAKWFDSQERGDDG